MVEAEFHPIQGTDLGLPSGLVVEKWESVRGIRLRPGTEGASTEPANRTWRPTQMPKKGLPEEICFWMCGR